MHKLVTWRALTSGLARRLLVGEDSRCDPADAFGVGDCVDLDDLALGDDETHDGKGSPTHSDDHSGCSVHQHGAQVGRRERAYACLLGNGRCAMNHLGGGGAPGAKVRAQHDVGIKQGNEGVEIAPTRGQEEGVDHSLSSICHIRPL